MPDREARKHPRIAYGAPITISWEDAIGAPKYARGSLADISQGGLRIEVLANVSVRTYVSLRTERLNLSGSATVRHVTRTGAKYRIGLELSQPLRGQALAAVQSLAPAGSDL
jgi:hypothetical protein